MIKGTHLRIGNWLIKDDGLPERITAITDGPHPTVKFLGFDHNTALAKCKPILLTEKWMMDIGFAKQYPYLINMHIAVDLHYANDKAKILVWDNQAWNRVTYINRSVHEVQNIYFALTGEELKTA